MRRYSYIVLLVAWAVAFLFISNGKAEKIEYPLDNYNLRDPFKSEIPKEEPKQEAPNTIKESAKEVVLPNFTVQGAVWQSQIPVAIIDNTVVKIGDVISDAKVVNISKNGIDLIYRDRLFTIATVPVVKKGGQE